MFLQLLQKNADYFPSEVALVHGDRNWTHLDYLRKVESLGSKLIDIGLERGQRVALFMENSPEYAASFFATAAAGGVNVPLNLDFNVAEIEFYLRDADVRVVIVDSGRAELMRSAIRRAGHDIKVIVNGETSGGEYSLESLLSAGTQTDLAGGAADDHIVYIYSSGSTGRPKCAPRTVLQYWWETQHVIDCLNTNRSDTIFCLIPLFHNFGAVHCMLAAAGSGAKLIIFDKVQPFALRRRAALKALEHSRATIFPCVPFMLDHLVKANVSADIRSVRVCYSAAAALTQELADAFFDHFGVPIRNHYGCSEVGAMTINLDRDADSYTTSVGQAFPGVSIRILDEDGHALPPGEVGEVVVSSRQMTSGYLGLDDVNRKVFRNGCFYTNDLGSLDENGNLSLAGRKKLIIDVVGQKFSPLEVEDVLLTHEAVTDAVVIGADVNGVQEVFAYVVLTGHCDLSDLRALCRAELAGYKVPSNIAQISSIPKNSIGKILRNYSALEAQRVDGEIEVA